MRFRNLDENGDWTFGKGKQSYLKENDALMLNLKTRLKSFLNDCFFATSEGIDWFNLLGSKNRSSILEAVRKVIIETNGVTQLNTVDIVYDRTSRALQLSYNINSQYTQNNEAIQEVLI